MYKITNKTDQNFQLLGGVNLKPYATITVKELTSQLKTMQKNRIIIVKKI